MGPAKGGRVYPKFTTPKTLTAQEQSRLLRAVHAQGSRRDRAILSLVLGTGLRLREVAGLNVGDVFTEGSAVAWKVRLDPKITKGGRGGVAFLNTGVRDELRLYLRWKHRANEPLEVGSALFLSNQRRRLCLRQIQVLFRKWQTAAGFETLYPIHSLRHSAITNVYRATKDLYLTQRFARHSSPLTTTMYTHPSDEELYEGIRRLRA
jgi:site-specific recombinase XerC